MRPPSAACWKRPTRVITADALHTQREHAQFLVTEKQAHYILVVKKNKVRPLDGGRWRTVTVYAITSLDAHQATPAQLAAWIRGHWQIEALHHLRDVSYGEDASQIRTGSGPQAMCLPSPPSPRRG